MGVECHDLRHVRHGISGEPCDLLGDQNVSWGVNEAEVASKRQRQDRGNAAAIEGISLNDQNRATKPGLGTTGLVKVRPPDFSATDLHRRSDRYQYSRPTAEACARRNSGSRLPASLA